VLSKARDMEEEMNDENMTFTTEAEAESEMKFSFT
jgi:hypothetical protein